MTLDDLTNIAAGDDRIDYVGVDQPRQQGNPGMDMMPYSPFAMRPNQTWDAQTMDRMLTIKRPGGIKSGQIWITEAGFAETLALLPLNFKEQRLYWKKFRRIQMISSGELNAHVVDSRQERLMMELVSQKSRLDVAEGGNMNERLTWVTNKQIIEQKLQTQGPAQPKGFFSSILGGK